ncbi:hypothetical protein ScPMuIL_000406 [Solemya velum]
MRQVYYVNNNSIKTRNEYVENCAEFEYNAKEFHCEPKMVIDKQSKEQRSFLYAPKPVYPVIPWIHRANSVKREAIKTNSMMLFT